MGARVRESDAYFIHLKIEVAQRSKLAFRRWITVGPKSNRISASSAFMVGYAVGGRVPNWIQKTVGKDEMIGTRLGTTMYVTIFPTSTYPYLDSHIHRIACLECTHKLNHCPAALLFSLQSEPIGVIVQTRQRLSVCILVLQNTPP